MKGYIYILLSEKDKRSYVGSTDNIQRRFLEHTNGKSNSTKNRRPLKLAHIEEYETLKLARIREMYLKSRKGRKELKEIFTKFSIGA